MADELSSVDAPATEDGKTSDQILAEIEAAQKAVSDGTTVTSPANAAPRSESVPESESGKQSQTVEASQATGVEPAPQGEPTQSEGKAVDIDEWMRKKGFKSVQDLARANRELEKEISKRQGKTLDEITPMKPEAIVTPPPQYVPQAQNLEQLAAQYETDPDSFRRVLKIVNDASDLKMRMAVTPLANEVNRLNRELHRKAVNEELERDPHFKNRVVMQEMYQLMESDPSIQNAPEPLKAAYEKSLINLGRRFVEGLGSSDSNQETRSDIPTTPPPMGKSGQGTPKGSHMKTSFGKMTPEKFNSLSSAEMEKYLAQQGMVRNETY